MSGSRGLIAAGVRNPVLANALMACILVGGYLSARSLVTETYPEFSLDRISIEALYPGASPEEVEQGVCTRIEEALEGLPGVRKVWSSAAEDKGLVMVELFENVSDPRLVMLDVKDRIDQIDTFPPEVEQPVIAEVLARAQVINLAVHGDAPERTIKEWAVEIKDELLSDESISQIAMVGVRDYEIAIQVSQEALLQYALTLQDVTAVVAKNCLDVPAGTLRTRGEELTLRTTGQRYTAREFEDLVVIARTDGTLIKLGQIANVTDGFAEDYYSGRFQGRPAAVLEVFKTTDQDTATIAASVRDYAARKQAELPSGLELDVWGDTSREVDARIAMLLENAVWGMGLVVLVLALFLDFRVSLYVALGIPVSFAGALIVMHFTGQTLNMITLFALIMVSGIIVDDAIVIADSFRSRVSRGDTPDLAAVNGTRAVVLPVLGSSATTIVAFTPILFVAGIMGKFIAVLPVVVISAIVFSAIEAFCILPSHLQHCLRDTFVGPAGKPVGSSNRSLHGGLNHWRTAVRHRIEQWTNWVITRVYRPFCARAMRARGVTLSIALACGLLVTGLVAGGRVPFTLFPEIDTDVLRARVRFPQGVPVARTKAAVRQLEAAAERLNRDPALRHKTSGDLVCKRSSVIGEWSGWVRHHGSHLCEVIIELKPAEQRRLDGQVILAAWEQQTGVIDDAVSVTFGRVQRGPADKPLEVRLLGDDLEELSIAADEVCAALGKFAGVTGIEHDLLPGRREIRVKLKPLARTLGTALDDLARQLRNGFYGGEAVRVQRARDEVRVQVRYPDRQRRSIADLENIRIRGAGGREIPFREVADYEIGRGYTTIQHQNGKRRVRITADVDLRRANAERILAEFEAGPLRTLRDRYPNLECHIEGQRAQLVESLRSLSAGLLIALVVIYAILAAMLASYAQPVVIMAAIPLGVIGVVLGHALTGYDLTILSVFGLVAMSGVVVNDSLVLLDRINTGIRQRAHRVGTAHQSGAGQCPPDDSWVFDAVLEAGAVRFRAVILTTVTTIAGLAPMLLERSTQAQVLAPMAISLVFGLAFATGLTLVVVPALYLTVIDVRRVAWWLRRGGAYPSAESVAMPRQPSSAA